MFRKVRVDYRPVLFSKACMNQITTATTAYFGKSHQKTMTSREIAELTGSSHDSVLKTVRRLVSEGIVSANETPYTHPQNGQNYSEFRLSFRDTMVVVSGYSAELRAKIIDRWQELEAIGVTANQVALHPAEKALTIFSSHLKGLTDSGITYDVAFRMANYAAFLATNVSFLKLDDLDTAPPAAPAKAAKRKPVARVEKSANPSGYYTLSELCKLKGLSADKINVLLTGNSLQIQLSGGAYTMTPKAKRLGVGIMHKNEMLWTEAAFS